MPSTRGRGFEPDSDYDDEPETPPAQELTVYPTDRPAEPVLWLPDGTGLYLYKPPFGFCGGADAP